MATERQIEANRRNSQFSTGPRTSEGKAASRFNALKSGIDAQSLVIPGEDPAELEALTDEYYARWLPSNADECLLVDSLIHANWQLRRLRRVQAQLWQHELHEAAQSRFNPLDDHGPLGDVYGRGLDKFTRLQRHLESTERSYHRASKELHRLKAAARPSQPEAEPASEPAPKLASFPQNPPDEPVLASIQPDAPCPGPHKPPTPPPITDPLLPAPE